MFSVVTAMAMAFGSSSVDGIIGKGRCSGGTCQAAPAAAKVETKKAECCTSSVKSRVQHRLKGLRNRYR